MKKGLSDLQVVKARENRFGLHRITFRQYYRQIPVEEALYKIHVFEDGRVRMANGFYYPDIQVSTSAALTSSEAIAAGKAEADLEQAEGESHSAELVVLPLDGGTLPWPGRRLCMPKNRW